MQPGEVVARLETGENLGIAGYCMRHLLQEGVTQAEASTRLASAW